MLNKHSISGWSLLTLLASKSNSYLWCGLSCKISFEQRILRINKICKSVLVHYRIKLPYANLGHTWFIDHEIPFERMYWKWFQVKLVRCQLGWIVPCAGGRVKSKDAEYSHKSDTETLLRRNNRMRWQSMDFGLRHITPGILALLLKSFTSVNKLLNLTKPSLPHPENGITPTLTGRTKRRGGTKKPT